MRLREILLPWKSKDKKCCLYKTPYVAAPIWVLGDLIVNFFSLRTTSFRRTYKRRIFLGHEWQVSEETRLVISRLLCEISTRRSTSKSGTGKDYLLHYLRSPAKSTFKHLWKQTPLWCIVMSKAPQEPWRSRWPQKWDVEQSAPTHARHTHCASEQLDTTANQRYDVPWDWLWDACQMARVHWGTSCEGFCSKEGPHYQIELSARNQLECDQVQRALGKSSRSCRQTSNNQPLSTTLEIPWGFLAQAVLRWLSRGLCHIRKCQFEEFAWEEKIWFASSQQTFAWETFSKRRNGERKPVLILVPGSQARLASRKHAMCARNMGAHVGRSTWSTKGITKNGMRNRIPAQPWKAQRN